MGRLKTRPFERNLAMTRLGLGAGTKIVAHSIANIFRGEIERSDADRDFFQRQAQILADELGQLKGSVMKAGQMLSLYGQYFLPPEAVEVLATLQDDTPAVDWKVVAPVLQKALGAERLRQLEIDETPIAAASLGQAHRARRRSDGMELVVKIQYPGVADSIDSDIKTLSRLLTMSRLTPKGLDVMPIFAELREMLEQEVDYVAERRFTENFRERFKDDSRYVVPQMLPEFCTAQVLTMSFESGVNVKDESVQNLSQKRRTRLGVAFLDLFLTEFFDWGMVQTDPHFGNYRIRVAPDGEDQIVLLDFGATRMFRRSFVEGYTMIVRGAVQRDRELAFRGAQAIGLMGADVPRSVSDAFAQMFELIVEPFNNHKVDGTSPELLNARGQYRWRESDLPMRSAQVAARNALSVHFRVPPREIVFLHRRLAGVFIVLATLGAEFNAREQLLRSIQTRVP